MAEPIDTATAVATLRASVLRALTEVPEPGWCLNLFGLQSRTGLSRDLLRGIVADLRRDGLVGYHKGLCTEDGMPGGSGYALTPAGEAVAAELDADRA